MLTNFTFCLFSFFFFNGQSGTNSSSPQAKCALVAPAWVFHPLRRHRL